MWNFHKISKKKKKKIDQCPLTTLKFWSAIIDFGSTASLQPGETDLLKLGYVHLVTVARIGPSQPDGHLFFFFFFWRKASQPSLFRVKVVTTSI